MKLLIRLKSAWYCLAYGYAAVPIKEYNTICISDDSLLLTRSLGEETSAEVALWALERPEHYWRVTQLGKEIQTVIYNGHAD